MYSTAPAPVTRVVPWAGAVASTTASVSPSGSLSLASTTMVTGVSSGVSAASSTASGASSTGSTVTLTSARAVSPGLSRTVYVKRSDPLKSGSGV